MTTITIVIQNSPYKENNKAWHALRFAGAALDGDLLRIKGALGELYRTPEGATAVFTNE